MEVTELIGGTRDALNARRVYGEPYEKNGLTVIPAATVRGGGGGGGGESPEGKGSGGGFGLTANPTGAWVITDGKVEWKPAVDVTRIALMGQFVTLAALFVVRGIVREHRRRRFDPDDVAKFVRRLSHRRRGRLPIRRLSLPGR